MYIRMVKFHMNTYTAYDPVNRGTGLCTLQCPLFSVNKLVYLFYCQFLLSLWWLPINYSTCYCASWVGDWIMEGEGRRREEGGGFGHGHFGQGLGMGISQWWWWSSHWLRKLGGWALQGWSWLMNLLDWSWAEQWSSCRCILRYDGCAGSAAGVRSLKIGCERAVVKLLGL